MKIITLAFILIFALSVPAQNLNFDNMDSAKLLSLLQSENLDSKNTINEPNIVSKILQIGDKNIVDVTLYPDNKLNSTQIGDYNTFIYQEFYPQKNNFELNVTTQGNGNYLDILGRNSISDGMIIKTFGNDKMIFIRNF